MTEQEEILEKVQAALMVLALGGQWPLGKHEPFISCPFIQRTLVKIEARANSPYYNAKERLVIESFVRHAAEMADLCHPHFVACFTCDGHVPSPQGYCRSAYKIVKDYQLAVQEAGI